MMLFSISLYTIRRTKSASNLITIFSRMIFFPTIVANFDYAEVSKFKVIFFIHHLDLATPLPHRLFPRFPVRIFRMIQFS